MRNILAALTIGVLVAAVPGGSASAHVKTGGAGSDTATVTSGRSLTAANTTVSVGNVNSTVPVTVKLSNPNSFNRWAHRVTATFKSSSRGACPATAYRINNSPLTVDRAIPSGPPPSTVSGITVTVVRSGCQYSNLTLAFTVN